MKPRDNEGETYIYDPYATDDPNVGEVHYGTPDPASSEAPGADDALFGDRGVGQPNADSAASYDGGPTDADLAAADVEYDFEPEFRVPIRRDRFRRSKNVSVPLDGDADEGSYEPRDDDDADGEKSLTQKQLRRRVQSKPRRSGRLGFNPAVLVMAIVYALVIGSCVFYAVSCRHGATSDPVSTVVQNAGTGEQGGSAKAPATTGAPDEKIVVPEKFVTVEVPSASVCEGDLILVNYEYPYVFPEEKIDVSIYANKTGSYKVSDTLVSLAKPAIDEFNRLMDDFAAASGCYDMIVVSGFRDYESQDRLWTNRVQSDGREEAAKYVALPGYSEHHTALAMDLSVYLSDGSSYYVEEYEPCKWFIKHAPEYGYILRYPASKAEITRISYESWHYRYVGSPHSEIITEREMCLEEYIDFIRTYRCGDRYLAFDGDTSYESREFPSDAEYAVYFVPRSSAATTAVPVPEGAEYSISGNNVDGFIVTVKCK